MITQTIVLSLIGLCFCALDIPDHLQAPMRLVHKACVAQTNVAEEHIANSREGFIPDVPELKCYILCLLEHAGMIEPDGNIHWSQVTHLLTPSIKETVDTVTKECATKHGATRCETAYLTLKCYFETVPKGSMLP